MFTRKQYMQGECTHREFYAQFVNPSIKWLVQQNIGMDRLLRSTDPHFNDIPLPQWDELAPAIGKAYDRKVMQATGDYLTLAGSGCIAKEAARQLVEGEGALIIHKPSAVGWTDFLVKEAEDGN